MGHIIGSLSSASSRAFWRVGFRQRPNNPSGFILTCVLGIAGAFPGDFHRPVDGHGIALDQGASFIGATIGAVVLLADLAAGRRQKRRRRPQHRPTPLAVSQQGRGLMLAVT